MPIVSQVKVRQPAPDDLVAEKFVISGIGSGFEGTVGLRVLNSQGQEIASGGAQAAGGMAGVGEFTTHLTIASPPRPGTKVTLQVFGDNPGPGPGPGSNLREVEVLMFPKLTGWLLYRVESGDTLTGIVRKARDFGKTTVAQIVVANDQIKDPDLIQVGWKLRIPLS